MKKIEAVIKPFKLDEVRGALAHFGMSGVTVSEVLDCGWRQSRSELGHGREFNRVLTPKIKLEIVLADDLCGPVSEAIVEAAITNSIDDGHIFISTVEEAVRICKEDKSGLKSEFKNELAAC